ncbi:hypothetical protein JCM8547_005229 [Rhodosporidiobolus lusitaniae]
MPRGLSKEAKAALLEGYNNPTLLPPASSFTQRLADYVANKTDERYTAGQCDTALTGMQKSHGFQRRPRGSGRGLTEQAKVVLRNGYEHRDQLDTSRGLTTALIEYVHQNTNPPELYDKSQIDNALYRSKGGNIAGNPGRGGGGSRRRTGGGGNPYEVETRGEDEASPHILHHQGMAFSGADHALVPNNEVRYDEQRQLYVDSQGQAVTPHWIDDEFF